MKLRPMGFVLPATVGLLIVLAITMACLRSVQSSHASMAQKAAADLRHDQVATVAAADFCASLQGETGLPIVVPSKFPVSGGKVLNFSFSDAVDTEVVISGQFNASTDASLHNPGPPPGPVALNAAGDLVTSDLYEPALQGGQKIPVPTRHSLLLFKTAGVGENRQYAGVYSSNFPYAMMAPQGSIALRDARAVVSHLGDQPAESGLPVNLSARSSIVVSDFFYGRGYVQTGGQQRLGENGLAVSLAQVPRLPTGLAGLSRTLASELSQGEVDLGSVIQSCPSAKASLQGAQFRVLTSLGMYPMECLRIPFDTLVDGDLLVPEDAVLHIAGELTVRGHIYMGNRSSLLVDRSLSAEKSLDLYQVDAPNQGITTTVVTGDHLSLPAGMSQTPGVIGYAEEDVNELSRYVQLVDLPLPMRPYEVPPALLVSGQDLRLGNTLDTRVAGLLVAGGSVQLTGNLRLIGAAFAERGDIQAATTRFSYFPYFSHAFVHSSTGNRQLDSNLYHLTAFGRI